ncbi:MAG TPA: hypothetical protein VL625_03755 [Patescibacteria group bacterium]|nr:hypothetical protein [Patescibacteria group bacterium]
MKNIIFAFIACTVIAGCGKIGAGGAVNQLMGNWAEVKLPADCKVKQIAGEEESGVIILCEDGRVFH